MPRSQLNDKPSVSQWADHYRSMVDGFGWRVPEHFNIAEACCARWAAAPQAGERIAVYCDGPGLDPGTRSYAELQQSANRLSNALLVLGVERGDRVAIVMPQCFETAVVYMAVLQMGAVAMPLSTLFGPQALEFRLHDSEAVVAICDASVIERLSAVREGCPMLHTVIRVGDLAADRNPEFGAVLAQEPDNFTAKPTFADKMMRTAANSVASSVGRQVAGTLGSQLLRGLLGGLFKGR